VKASAWELVALVSLLWPAPYLFLKIALRDTRPLSIAAARKVLAALVMVPFLQHRQRWRAILRQHVWGDAEGVSV
jgi:hypothetical protein